MAIQDMVNRKSDFDESKDYIPTPPYVTRMMFTFIPELKEVSSIWDPAAGGGHMVRVFDEMGIPKTLGTDLYDHGAGYSSNVDFTKFNKPDMTDAIVTNPPYKHLNKFIDNGLICARRHLVLLVRIQALTGQKKFDNFYNSKDKKPTGVFILSDRIDFKTGEVVEKAPKMFDHMFLWWDKEDRSQNTFINWIDYRARAKHERKEDYEH